ncbi:MAG: PAS domain S-box protein [Acidobacteria bacterium]|nr:PAS domain S-box protein [Acidobacteriota bacterium]
MGDWLSQPTRAAELLRAKFLKAVLDSGDSPSLFSSETREQSKLRSSPDDPEIQKAYLDELFENAPEAITVLDTDCYILRVNGEFTRLFGYTQDEALGREIGSLIVPADLQAESQSLAEGLSRGQEVSLETRRRRKDGTLVDVSILGRPVNVAGGHVALYAIYRDITQQKRADTLRSALYRIADETNSAEDLPQFYRAIHTIVGELMYARNFYIALYDMATEYLSFPYWVDEIDPPPPPRKSARGLTEYVVRSGEPLLASPEVFADLVRCREADQIGAPSVDWLGVPLKVGNTSIGAVVVQSYNQDIRFSEKHKEILTFVSQQLASAIEHKRHEEALRRSEARYRSLVQSAAYGIYRARRDGKFLEVNPAIVTMLGYESADEVLALDPQADVFRNPEELQRLMEEWQRKGRLDNFEIKWQRKDETVITVRLSGRVVSNETDLEEFLEVIAEDVTEKRVLEDQFRQAQKMEAVGRLAGGVAHDFNNLLMVISGYTEVLLEKLEGPLHAKAEAVQQAAERATTLTRQLLAFSRRQLLELKVVDLNTIISDMERLLTPLIGETIQLTTELDPALGHTRADAGQLEQVLMNLVVNAKDAMPGGGKIIIRTSNVELDGSYRREHTYIQRGPYIMLSVSDTGCGMDKETQSRIFEPFFTTKEKGKGTGLGLSTVYGIIKQSGGYIFAHSEIGHGTTFRIFLPRVEQPAECLGTVKRTQGDTRGSETVLLVEDEESVRRLVRETLESRGYKVMEAADGERALEMASTQKPVQLMITDVVMPGINGQELAKEIVKIHPRIKMLFLSGYAEDTIRQQALPAGTAFLQKPFTLQTLLRKTREVLGNTAASK